MTTSQKMSLQSVICREDVQLKPFDIGYFNARCQDLAHETVVKAFEELAGSEGLTRAFIARRLGKKPEQITRWLGAPGNWTLETLSNLLVAIGCEPTIGYQRLDGIKASNYYHPAACPKIEIVRAPTNAPYQPGILTIATVPTSASTATFTVGAA